MEDYDVFLQQSLRFEGLNELFEFSVPRFAETAYERVFEELIDGQTQFAALLAGSLADAPAVIVEGYGAVAETLLADGVEVATDGFGP